MSTIINNLKLRTKFAIGFGTLITLMLAISTLSYLHFETVGHEVEEMELAAEELALAANLEVQFLKMTRAARQFVQKGDDASEAEAKKFAAKTHEAIAAAKAGIKVAKHVAQVEAIESAFKSYEAGFFEVIELQHEHDSLIEKGLDPTADKMIEDLDALIADARAENNQELALEALEAREHAFLIQVYTGRLLLEGKQSYAEKVSKEFVTFEKTLNKMTPILHTDHEKDLHKELLELRAKYQTIYEKVLLDEEKIYKKMDVNMPNFAGTIIQNAEALEHEASEHEHKVAKAALDEIAAAEFEILLLVAIGGLVGVGASVLLTIIIGNPIRSISNVMRQLADGNLEAEVIYHDRKDEIGDMATTVQIFKNNAIRVKEMEIEQEEQAHRAEEEKKAAMMKLATNFENTVGNVVGTVSSASTELESSAEAMSSTADQANERSSVVASASENASSNVQTVAVAAEELSASIGEITRQVAQSATIANEAVQEVETTTSQINGLAEASSKIGTVVALITDIADQTNLLALNATIEAARAGDAGKGFAVVASEVKNLANQTAKATEEISVHITEIQNSTQDAVTAIGGIGKTIGTINEVASAIAAAVEEQGAATQEIARNVEQAARGTEEVSTNITGVTQAVSETGQAAGEILSASSELSQQAVVLKDEVATFLTEVRAA